ncbi:MAG: crossover junction endodeoxyribonuclease RuvC [bacterium]
MFILGIDPGIAITGYGIIEVMGHKFRAIDYGCIKTATRHEDTQRLLELHTQLGELIVNYQPSVMAVEEIFFNKNTRTAMSVGQARGVALLTAARFDLDVVEYTPLQVKQGIVGYGRANKQQVQEMVKVLLGLEQIPQPDDAADALAIAICHAHALPLAGRLERLKG